MGGRQTGGGRRVALSGLRRGEAPPRPSRRSVKWQPAWHIVCVSACVCVYSRRQTHNQLFSVGTRSAAGLLSAGTARFYARLFSRSRKQKTGVSGIHWPSKNNNKLPVSVRRWALRER